MSGSTGERPFAEILTDLSFWKLHFVNIPAIFISGFLFVSTGLAYDAFGTPRPDEYFPLGYTQDIPIVTTRMDAKSQLDGYFQEKNNPAKTAPSLFESQEN